MWLSKGINTTEYHQSMSAGSRGSCTETAFCISAVLLCGSGKWSDQTVIGQNRRTRRVVDRRQFVLSKQKVSLPCVENSCSVNRKFAVTFSVLKFDQFVNSEIQ
jgi:hypothetical protein